MLKRYDCTNCHWYGNFMQSNGGMCPRCGAECYEYSALYGRKYEQTRMNRWLNWLGGLRTNKSKFSVGKFVTGSAIVLLFAGAVWAFSTADAAEIYQCKDRDGRRAFSDKPCGDNAEIINVEPSAPTGARFYSGDTGEVLSRPTGQVKPAPTPAPSTTGPQCPSDDALMALARKGQVAMCMTPAMVDRAAGKYREDFALEHVTRSGQPGTTRRYGRKYAGFPNYVEFGLDGRVTAFYNDPLSR